jgi:hypothetical protein
MIKKKDLNLSTQPGLLNIPISRTKNRDPNFIQGVKSGLLMLVGLSAKFPRGPLT